MAVIDMGTPTAFAFNEATVSGRNGISGAATLTGTSLDGTVVRLFETTVGYAESLTVTYYAWPELAALSFEATDGDGASLSAFAGLRQPGPGATAGSILQGDSGSELLAALEFPFRLQPFGVPLQAMPAAELAGGGPGQAARIAAARLFVTGRRAAPLVALTLWTLAVFIAAALPRSLQAAGTPSKTGRPDERWPLLLAALACAVTVMTAAVFMLGATPAELFAVSLDADQATASGGAGTDASTLVRKVSGSAGYRTVSWSPPDGTGARADGLWFIGIRSPRTAAVPVSAFDGYRRLRFKTPPLVVAGTDGRAMLAPAPFAAAWGLHE